MLEVVRDEFQMNQNYISNQDHGTVGMCRDGMTMAVGHDYGFFTDGMPMF